MIKILLHDDSIFNREVISRQTGDIPGPYRDRFTKRGHQREIRRTWDSHVLGTVIPGFGLFLEYQTQGFKFQEEQHRHKKRGLSR